MFFLHGRLRRRSVARREIVVRSAGDTRFSQNFLSQAGQSRADRANVFAHRQPGQLVDGDGGGGGRRGVGAQVDRRPARPGSRLQQQHKTEAILQPVAGSRDPAVANTDYYGEGEPFVVGSGVAFQAA